jgi:CRP-like cAMP-binding protein
MPPKPIEAETLLEHLPMFHHLRAEQRRDLAAQVRRIEAGKGETLFRRGEMPLGLYVVVYGQVKLAFTGNNGVEKVIDVRGAGQSFGEAVLFLEKPHVVTAQTLSDSLLLLLPGEAIFERIDRDPGFARAIIGGLSRKLHELVADVEWLSTRSGTERVIGFLLRDCGGELDAVDAGGAGATVCVELPVAKGVIASRLNLTQEHFSRILHDLSAANLISVQGRQITVRDLARLRTYFQ